MDNTIFPMISIIVPVYNVENFLDRCIDSIVNQTYKNLEIILVDDGSKDNSSIICDKWAEQDSRIKVIHKENGGASVARNVGLDIAGGEYIGFVDSDDYIDENMYSSMLNAIQGTSIKVACCRSITVSIDDNDVRQAALEENDVQILDTNQAIDEVFSFRMGTSVWRRLYHRSVFDKLRFPVGEINEDYPMLIPTIVGGGGTVFLQKALYYYRDRSDSITGTLHKSEATLQCVLKNLSVIKQQLDENGVNIKSFSLFTARNSFFMLLLIIKHYSINEGKLGSLFDAYHKLARENKRAFLMSPTISLKNKFLFILVLTGLYSRWMSKRIG